MNQCVNRFKAKWQKIECIEATNGKISNDVYRNHIVQMTSFLGFIVFFSSGVIFWFFFHLILHHSVHRIKRHTHHYRKHKITSVRKHSQAERMSLKSVCLNVVSSEQCVLNAVRCVALLCFAMHFFCLHCECENKQSYYIYPNTWCSEHTNMGRGQYECHTNTYIDCSNNNTQNQSRAFTFGSYGVVYWNLFIPLPRFLLAFAWFRGERYFFFCSVVTRAGI